MCVALRWVRMWNILQEILLTLIRINEINSLTVICETESTRTYVSNETGEEMIVALCTLINPNFDS